MAKAKRVLGTPRLTAPKIPAEFHEKLSKAYRGLESQVHDLNRLSEIADRLVAQWLDVISSNLPREGELAVCAVSLVADQMKQFRTVCLRAWNDAKEVA
jgi:hypothetical protein